MCSSAIERAARMIQRIGGSRYSVLLLRLRTAGRAEPERDGTAQPTAVSLPAARSTYGPRTAARGHRTAASRTYVRTCRWFTATGRTAGPASG